TFFLVGQNVHKRAATVARMAAQGNEVGNHTWDHPKLPTLSAAEQRRQLDRTSAAIAAAGARATVFRPSYGAYDATTRQVVGLPLILWNVDTLDWKTRNADTTVRIAQCGVHRNAIVLMHDIHAPSAEAVPRVVAALQAKGLTLVTVSHLLRGRDQPGVAYEHG
ncbi:polysaccharide deacetylase family protein, partial [Propioniciclava sp.]|uniref:polysaccharide deacetylase family protein n=1 Tax=Propioniciclava sp. TaxID=2038686 RepID=UPI0026330D90